MNVIDPAEEQRSSADVLAWLERTERPGAGTITRVAEASARGDGGAVAVRGTALLDFDRRLERRIQVIDTAGTVLADMTDDAVTMTWVGQSLVTAGSEIRVYGTTFGTPVSTHSMHGSVEHLAAAPDSKRVAAVLAPTQDANWDAAPAVEHPESVFSPDVYRTGPEQPREVWILDTGATQPPTRIDCGSWNVWECAWIDDRRLAVIASAEAGETGWYAPVVGVLTLPEQADNASKFEVVYSPLNDAQLASVTADADRIAVVEGIASDRGLVAGRIRIIDDGVTTLDVGGDASRIVLRSGLMGWSALHGLTTLAGVVELQSGERTAVFAGPETFTGPLPAVDMDDQGNLYALVESYRTPPRLQRLTRSSRDTLFDYAHEGTAELLRTAGNATDVTWTAPDGTEIEGIVVAPDAPGPHPLIMIVHGGPVAAWRGRWGMQNVNRHPYAGLLAEQGIATFYPNPRGSVGRGQNFVDLVRGDMCGADAGDLLAGIDHLIRTGIADTERIGVTGNSYGGTMSSWLSATTTRFRMAIVTSPAVDLVSQHHLSNIPAFDELFTRARVEASPGSYIQRSPIAQAHRSSTPTLVTAGLLDKCTPPSQAVELHQAIRRAGGVTEMALYPQQAHGIADFPETADFLTRFLAWTRTYL